MAELCENRKQEKMGRVRLNSLAQCALGGVPVSEDTACPPPPCEALKDIIHCMEKKKKNEVLSWADEVDLNDLRRKKKFKLLNNVAH